MGDEEPPRKKRRSKWDITPSEPSAAAESQEATVSSQPAPAPGFNEPPSNVPSSAMAAAAAAKLNAMLASQGKLVKSDPPLTKPTRPTPSLLPPPPASSSTLSPSAGLLKPSGLLAPPTTAPLFTPGGPHYVQDKVFVGLEQAPESFKVVEKLQGPGGSYLQHIATQTGAKVFLRGRGSGYIEPTSGKESFEALHIYISHPNKSGLGSARKLSESLILTVKEEYESFKTSQQKSAPLGFGSAPGYAPPPPAHGYVNPYQTSFPPPPPPGGVAPPPPGYPPAPGYAPPYQGQPPPPGPPGPPGPVPAGPNYGYYPLPGGSGAPPPSDPYGMPLPPPPHPGAFYPHPPPPAPYAAGGVEFGGGAPPPHPGHFHPPSHLPPGPMESHDQHAESHDQRAFYRPHNRSPEPPPKRKFTEQVEKPGGIREDDRPNEHFSISNAGNSSSNENSQTNVSGNGHYEQHPDKATFQDDKRTAAPSRKFTEGPHPVVSSSSERVGGEIDGSGPPSAKEDGGNAKSDGAISKGTAPKKEQLTIMKSPSLLPPSKLKETSAMPPPPSLPPRFAKASPGLTKSAGTPNATVTSTSTTTTAESAKDAAPPNTGNHDNNDTSAAAGSPKPTKVLSSLVAYGDDSDSDIDA